MKFAFELGVISFFAGLLLNSTLIAPSSDWGFGVFVRTVNFFFSIFLIVLGFALMSKEDKSNSKRRK